jgi:hypothetical protein
MLNTYIKNRGTTQTLINNNSQKLFNTINWDADYDGQQANISINTDTDGNKNHYEVKLYNEDLANLLNIPSISMPIHKRLLRDFDEESFRRESHKIPNLKPRKPEFYTKTDDETIQELLQSIKQTNYLSSPLPNEELIAPITIDDKTINDFTLTPHKRHKRPKTHKTYKVYKKPRSSSLKKYSPKSKSKSKSTRSFTLF